MSACGPPIHEPQAYFEHPGLYTLEALTAYAPPFPRVGVGAGALDSAYVTLVLGGDTVRRIARYTYGEDTTTVTEVDDGRVRRLRIPSSSPTTGTTVARLDTFTLATARWVTMAERETRWAGGRAVAVTDLVFPGGPSSPSSVYRARELRYDVSGRLVQEVGTAAVLIDGGQAERYDSLRVYYGPGARPAGRARYAGQWDRPLRRVDSAAFAWAGGGFAHLRYDSVGAAVDSLSSRFAGRDEGFVLRGRAFARTDDGTDPRYRAYASVEGGLPRYEYFYRDAVSAVVDAPGTAWAMRGPNPVAAGRELHFEGAPPGARYAIRDLGGRLLSEGHLGGGGALSWPGASAATYALTVYGVGGARKTWMVVAK